MGALGIGLGTATKRDRYRGKYVSLAALQAAVPVGIDGDRANVDSGSGSNLIQYNWDANEGWIATAGGGGGGTDRYKGTWTWAANANANPVAWTEGDYGYGIGERFNPGDDGYVADGQKIERTNTGFKYT